MAIRDKSSKTGYEKYICMHIHVLCTEAEGTENNDNQWEMRLRTHPQWGATRSRKRRAFFLLLESERSPFICEHLRTLLTLAAPLRNSNNSKKKCDIPSGI